MKKQGLLLGTHVSIAGGVDKAPARAAAVGCTAFQMFVKNNNRWEGPPISTEAAARFSAELERVNIPVAHVFAHACYLINPAGSDPELLRKSEDALVDELNRCGQLGLPGLVLHPGSHLGRGREPGLEAIGRLCGAAIGRTPDVATRILFEGTAGLGNTIGGTFEDLKDILDILGRPDRTGVCLDTCHLFAAGHELRTPAEYTETMASFDRIVGFKHLRAVHLNDSRHPLGSHKDRHEHIGKGTLGLEPFRHLLNDGRFARLPMALETEKSEDMHEDVENLAVLRGLIA